MHPCFRGLVLNVVLDVFLPLIGVWLQGERWQLGETAMPLMNSSSSIQPKRPVDTASPPPSERKPRSPALSLLGLGPRGQPALFATFHTTPLDSLLPALLLLWLQVFVLERCQLHFVLQCPFLFNSPYSRFSVIWLPRLWPITDYLQWSEDLAVCSALDAQRGFIWVVCEPIRMCFFRVWTLVKVGGFNYFFAKGSTITSV